MTYRTGNHQPQNVYRDEQYIGVMFTPEDAALVVEALNGKQPALCLTWIGREARMCELRHGHGGDHEPADSCTCVYRPNGGADPNCPVHQGRRARGPKPPPLGPGCICDGSGRTCPRHGVVL
jgi:hypothetical protein